MPTRLFTTPLLVVVAAAMVLMAGCEGSTPRASTSATTPTPSASNSPSGTPTPSDTPTPTPTETPEPITPPESEYTDTGLASMVAAVSVAGQQPQILDAQQVRWQITSLSVSPQECAVLLTGLSAAASRGLPVAMATLGPETDQYTIVVVGADDATREQVVTDRKLASKRCSKLTTSYGDPVGSNTQSTEWVVRQGSPADELEDVIEIDLTTASGAQQRVIAGRLGNILIQVTSYSTEPGGGEQLGEVVAAVALRMRSAQGSATSSASPTPTPAPTPTPSQ